MQVINNELPVFCDVDFTLASWIEPTVPGIGKVEIEFAGKKVFLTPHQYHVDLLKMYKERGYYITVWSANGWRHAERVVIALGLQDVVHQVMSKPAKHMDDSADTAAILGPRVFCEDLTKPNIDDIVFTKSQTFVVPPDVGQIEVIGYGGTSFPGGTDENGTYYIDYTGTKVYKSQMRTVVLGGVLNGR